MSTSSNKPITREFKARRKTATSPAAVPKDSAAAAPKASAAVATPAAPESAPETPGKAAKSGTEAAPAMPDGVLKERRKSIREIPVPDAVESESDTDWAAFQELASGPTPLPEPKPDKD